MKNLLALLIFLIVASPVHAAIALDNTQTLNGDSSATSHTYSNFVVASNSNRLLVVVVGYGNSSPGALTTTFGGVSLTSLISGQSSSNARGEFWYLKSPTVSTGDVVITNANATRITAQIFSLYNVDQTTTFRDSDESHSTSVTTVTKTLDSASGDWMIDYLWVRHASSDPGTLVPTLNGGTEVTEYNLQTVYRSSGSYEVATTTTIVSDWSWTSTASVGHVAATIIPALPGGSSVLQMMKRRSQ